MSSIAVGSRAGESDNFRAVYRESNEALREERDVFAFFHLGFLEPHERCA